MTSDQFSRTQQLVEKFGSEGGQGEELQARLLEYADSQENWVRVGQGQGREGSLFFFSVKLICSLCPIYFVISLLLLCFCAFCFI